MYISHIALENYAGIFSGTGKKEISIDFPNPESLNSRIVLLLGGNGSGKSTLMSALHPFAETFDFRDDPIIKSEEEGKKEIHFSDKNGLRYIITHHYSRTKKGGLKLKSFIQKFDNKKTGIELNENGGVTTFKNKIKEEFRLDSDYFKIGKLASQTANFCALQTAQRKDFIIQYLPNSEPYLEAHKNSKDKLNKIKDLIEYLANSLNMLGNREEIESKVNEYQKLFKEISDKLNDSKSLLMLQEKKLNELKDSDEYKQYFELIKEKEVCETEIEDIDKNFSLDLQKALSRFNPNELFDDKPITLAMEKLAARTSDRDVAKEKMNNEENLLKDIYKKISTLQAELEKKKADLKNYSDSKYTLEQLEEMKKNNEEELNNLKATYEKFSGYKTIIRFEKNRKIVINYSSYIQIRQIFMDVLSEMQYYYANKPDCITEESVKHFIESRDMINYPLTINNLKSLENKIVNELDDLKKEYNSLNIRFEEAKKQLKDRPDNCNNDNCPFIKYYLENSKLKEIIDEMSNRIKIAEDKLKEVRSDIIENEFFKDMNAKLYSIDYMINESPIKEISNTIYETILGSNHNYMETILAYESNENLLKSLQRLDRIYNYLKTKEDITKKEEFLKSISTQIESVTNNAKFIKDIKDRINEIENDQLPKCKEEEDNIRKELEDNKNKYKKNVMIVSTIEMYIEKRKHKEEVEKKLEKVNKKLDKNKEINEKISYIDNARLEAEKAFKLIEEEYNKIEKELISHKTNLSKYDEFDTKYKEATEQSKTIEVVVNSCDPKKGIPLAFMQEFLNSTSEFANELFDLAYNGKFRINFEVNEKEFNIPVLKEDGSVLNDIKEASDGESSLIKTIISLALLSRYNSVFPIICLDEVDGCLDDKYRSSFSEIIEGQIEVLGLEQVFVISHNENFRNEDIPVILFPRNTFSSNEKNLILKKL